MKFLKYIDHVYPIAIPVMMVQLAINAMKDIQCSVFTQIMKMIINVY